MSEMDKEKTKLNNKPTKQSSKKDETKELSEKIDKLISMYEQLHEDLALCIKVNHIVVELLGGVSPGRKNLDCIDLIRLRNEGVKIKDLAKMQGISECAMNRKFKEMREAGLFNG